jgi:septal ring factor EnvC (AmiA/AmiB activator)
MTIEPQPSPALRAAARRRRELREALATFEDAISSPFQDTEAWRSRVADRLEALEQAFAEHVIETERPDGLYDEMSQEASHVAARAGRLRAEHPSITAAIAKGRRKLAEPLRSEPEVDAVRDDLQRLMTRIIRHRQGGADLVWEAYAIDIGGAG